MQHSKECLELQEQANKLIQKWVEMYPDYCRECGGMGGFSYPATYYELATFEECSCREKGKCPRCGHQFPKESLFAQGYVDVCPMCGWDSKAPDGLPAGFECWDLCIPVDSIDISRYIKENSPPLTQEELDDIPMLEDI